jgi:hypothetical protein
MADFSEKEKKWMEDILGNDDGVDPLGPDGFGNDDYAIAWDMHCGSVVDASLKEFVGEGHRRHFDFGQICPRLDLYPPEWQEFHDTHIVPIARQIQPLPEGTPDETTMLQRFQAVAPLIRGVMYALPGLEQLEFKREEIEGDYETLLRWYSGQAHGLSWIESFFGKPIPQPKSCAAMARMA